MSIEILLGALAEAIFNVLLEDIAQQPKLSPLREKLKGPSAEKYAFQLSLAVAYVSFSREFPELSSSFFDEYFLQKDIVVTELSKLLTPNKSPNQSLLVQTWQIQFSKIPQIDLQEPLNYFINILGEEIKSQPLLKPFVDSRAFEQLYTIAQSNEEQITIQMQIRDLLVEINELLKDNRENNTIAFPVMENDQSMDQPDIQDGLIDLLLRVPAFQIKENRDALLLNLENITSFSRSNNAVADIVTIVSSLKAVGQLVETGEWPLVILMRNAQRYCPPSTELGRELTILLTRYKT